jgi:hypothetical protein
MTDVAMKMQNLVKGKAAVEEQIKKTKLQRDSLAADLAVSERYN